jgi:hypothetical protein
VHLRKLCAEELHWLQLVCPPGATARARHALMWLQEEILRIEYVESLVPPQESVDIKEDDWISSVKGTTDGAHFLVGSYKHSGACVRARVCA